MNQFRNVWMVCGLVCLLLIGACTFTETKPATQTKIEQFTEIQPQQEKPEPPVMDTGDVKLSWSVLPRLSSNLQFVVHHAFSLGYNEKYEQAAWVAYVLSEAETNARYERSNDFEEDPMVSTGSATDNDYARSGYDRGHLAPAADMSFSELTMQESFYYSNMSPQEPSFNRGIWKKLEELMRSWAVEYDSIYVVTGPVFNSGMTTIGANKVAIPSAYYKVVVKRFGSKAEGIGFILPNQSSTEQLQSFVVSIDEVERKTGLDFFSNWNDRVENNMESNTCIDCWIWKASKQYRSHPTTTETAQSVQCLGITKKGTRCKRMTKDPSGFCYQHQ